MTFEDRLPLYREVLRDTQCQWCGLPLPKGESATWFYGSPFTGYWCRQCHLPYESFAKKNHSIFLASDGDTVLEEGESYCQLAGIENCHGCGKRLLLDEWCIQQSRTRKNGIPHQTFLCTGCKSHYSEEDPGRPF